MDFFISNVAFTYLCRGMHELRELNPYLYRYRLRLFPGILFVVLSNVFVIFPAQVIRIAFDLVNENIALFKLTRGFAAQDDLYSFFGLIVLWFGLIVFVLALIRGLFLFLMRQTIIVVSRLIEYDLKNAIYKHYQELSLAFYRRHNTGDLMARATEDVTRVRMYLGPAIMYTINAIVLFVLVIGTMLSINVELTIYTVLPLPVLVVVIYYVNSLINKKSEEIQTQLSGLSVYVQETFAGIRVIKSFVRGNKFSADFAVQSELYKDKSMDLAKVQAFFYPTMLVLIGLSTTLTVFIGGLQVSSGQITPGTIAEFIVYINQLTMPVTALGWVTSLIQRAAASQKRINEFLLTPPEIEDGTKENNALAGDIEFRNVSFVYPDTGIRALNNISFHIRPGQVLAILGRTGAGKTTIANLMTRMYDVTEGEILVDGINIKEYTLDSLRRQIGFVPQEVFLFSDTLYNNIAFGLDATTPGQVEQAARDASIYDNIMAFPLGFQTYVGERGITLSGGQKQRSSIARALIKEPRILLLDDCLSAVDTHTEEEILQNLGRIMKNKTSMIISHRVSTIRHADQILVLQDAGIAENGNHDQLMALKGVYADLFEKQLLEEEI